MNNQLEFFEKGNEVKVSKKANDIYISNDENHIEILDLLNSDGFILTEKDDVLIDLKHFKSKYPSEYNKINIVDLKRINGNNYIELEKYYHVFPNQFKNGGVVNKNKFFIVMNEFKNGKLYTSYGTKVTDRKQALAIALSEASSNKKGRYMTVKNTNNLPDILKQNRQGKKSDNLLGDGGKIGFKKLSNIVAERYENKKVEPKYQLQYGKVYDKEEAKEVGDKVAGSIYKKQNMMDI